MDKVDNSKHKKGTVASLKKSVDAGRKTPYNTAEVIGSNQWHEAAVSRNKAKQFPKHSQ